MPAGVVEADRAWFRCLHSSIKIQIKRFADPNEAMEAVFSACRAEEDGFRAALMTESHMTSQEAATMMAYLKPKAKEAVLVKDSP